jgi:hypothetical protein
MPKTKAAARKPKATAQESIEHQEAMVLGPYIDYLEENDTDSFIALANHAGIDLRGDPIKQILRHYWLGGGQYDIERCANDFATYPPIANHIAELRREQRAAKARH